MTESILTNKCNKVKYNKKYKLDINQPKSIVSSKKFIKVIETYLYKNSELYKIVFEDSNIELLESKKILEDVNLINKESLILASFIFKFHNNLSSNFIKLINEIAKPLLYIFMLPLVTKNNKYIIKIGYTTDLIKRHNELKKEFNVPELKLIYCYVIDGEHTELNIHKNLEKTFCSSIYKMVKNENIEKTIISEETYIFSWLLLKNTYNILYRDYIMKDKLILIEKETELKKADTELKKADTELKKADAELKKADTEFKIADTEFKIADTEFKIADTELKKIELAIKETELKKNEIELKKIELELKKIELELKKQK